MRWYQPLGCHYCIEYHHHHHPVNITRSCYFRLSTFCVCLTCWFTTTPSRHEPTHASKHPNNCRTAKWIHFSSSFKIRIQQRLKGVGIKLKNDVCFFFLLPKLRTRDRFLLVGEAHFHAKRKKRTADIAKNDLLDKSFCFFDSNQIIFFFCK